MKQFYIPPKHTNTYYMPTKVFYGRGDFIKILKLIHSNGPQKVLLICGNHFKTTPHFNNLVAEMKKENELDVYNQTIKCSDFRTVNTLTNFLRENSYKVVLGIGGGTILDTAKSARVL